ncbi:MAG: TolC family protein, partial [Sphaerochaetaceae bacterium]
TLLYKLAQSSYTSTINTLEGQVASAYWNVVAANLALNIQQLDMQNKQASLSRVNERYEGGLATTLEVSEAELSVSNAKVLLQQQQQAVANAKLTLQNLIGEPVETTSDDLVEPRALESLEYLNALALQTSTIKTLKLNAEKAELTYAQTNHTAFSPALSFSASTSFSGEISTTGTQLQDNTTLSVSLSVPLDSYLPNSKAQIDRKNLDNDITIANNNLTHGIETLLARIQQSYSVLAQAEATLQYLGEYKAVTDKNFELTQSAYEAGEIPYSSLEDTQNNRSNASLAILQQQVTYTLALYDLSNLLETDINTLFQ